MSLKPRLLLAALPIILSLVGCKPVAQVAEAAPRPPPLRTEPEFPRGEPGAGVVSPLVTTFSAKQAQGLLNDTGIEYFSARGAPSEAEFPSLFRQYPRLRGLSNSQISDLRRRDQKLAADAAELAFEKDPGLFKSRLASMPDGEKPAFASVVRDSIARQNMSVAQAMFDSVSQKMEENGFNSYPKDEIQLGLMRRQLDKFMDEAVAKTNREQGITWKWDSGTLTRKKVTPTIESNQVFVSPGMIATGVVVLTGGYLLANALSADCGASAAKPIAQQTNPSLLSRSVKIIKDNFYLKDNCVAGICVKIAPPPERESANRPVGGLTVVDSAEPAPPCDGASSARTTPAHTASLHAG